MHHIDDLISGEEEDKRKFEGMTWFYKFEAEAAVR